MIKQIEKFIKEKTPFAVIQYFEFLKCGKTETYKKYELMFINKKGNVVFKVLEPIEIDFIKSNPDHIKMVLDIDKGKVWEHLDFKEYKNKTIK